jgi:signal transduction histidine kinase
MRRAKESKFGEEWSSRQWERHTPLVRRISMRTGLQGKLIFSFMAVITATLAICCWTFLKMNRDRLTDLMSEQTRQLATALSESSGRSLRDGVIADLKRTGEELLKSRNVEFIAYLDTKATPLIVSSRDPAFRVEDLSVLRQDARMLTQVRQAHSPLVGDYLQVVTPVMYANAPLTPRLVGYVVVGVNGTREQAQLAAIGFVIMGIAGCALIVSLPLISLVVYRIFLPIRELASATKRITGGDLDARVAIHRPDMIGELARSFNEMVQWVKKQRQDLAAANGKLFEANRDLEMKIEHRTAQLETANTRLSKEIAEKEDFLRAVSHDLNAPLRNIAGMATMLLSKHKDDFDQDVVHRLERIKKNVDVETDLIGELLELSRIKTRRQKMEEVNLESMIWDLRGVLENDLKSKAIDLIVDTSLPSLNCERARIRQVFQNLIDNAIKYMGEGDRREIHIGCTIRMTEAEFWVRDTGIGIDPEDLDKVFFIFRRGKNTSQSAIVGKGIGLASVKSIIETYNGKIWVTSKPGEGSTFRFTINGKHLPMGSGSAVRRNHVSAST